MAVNESYEDFVEKFKPKKTTDDCYTPPGVYAVRRAAAGKAAATKWELSTRERDIVEHLNSHETN